MLKTYGPKPIAGWGAGATITARVEWTDHLSITAEIRRPRRRDCEACGCLHDEIATAFPELAPLIPYHLCGTDGPMHYLADTVFLAGDRDCWGLRAGETRQIKDRQGRPAWKLDDAPEPRYAYGEDPFVPVVLEWRPFLRVGEGKDRELDAARRRAIWPEATDEDLTAPGLEDRLRERLPDLLARFHHLLQSYGLEV